MIITQTPLRISFAGGGTDFRGYYQKNGGVVLSTTIDKYIFVIVKKRFDKKIRVGYSTTEMVNSLDELKAMVDELKDCLYKEYLDDFGRILHRGWRCKKRMASEISNEKIDELYEKAQDAGALGGKITGAGGGGFMLLYCPQEKQDKVREALKDLQELPFRFNEHGTRVIFNI